MVRKKESEQDKKDAVVNTQEKEVFMNDLKNTVRDLGRLPLLIMGPIIAFIGKKYDTLPKERRESLQAIVENIKKNGSSGLDKLKERGQTALRHDTTAQKAVSKKTTGKKIAKKTKKITPKTKKVATKSTTSKAMTAKKTTNDSTFFERMKDKVTTGWKDMKETSTKTVKQTGKKTKKASTAKKPRTSKKKNIPSTKTKKTTTSTKKTTSPKKMSTKTKKPVSSRTTTRKNSRTSTT